MSKIATRLEYTVILEQGTNNWSAFLPDLPGCIAPGLTRKATLDLMREAIEFHLEGMRIQRPTANGY